MSTRLSDNNRIKIVRADGSEAWLTAAVCYIRIGSALDEEIPIDKEIDETDLSAGEYVVAFSNDTPVGTCRLHLTSDDEAKIERVVVSDGFRGYGIGRRMIEEAEKWLIEKGIRKIVVTSRESATGFYKSLGYTVFDDRRIKGKMFDQIYTEKEVK